MDRGELGSIHRGTHSCLIYQDDDEYVETLARIFEKAEAARQRILWIRRDPDTGPVQQVFERTKVVPRDRRALQLMDSGGAVSSMGVLDRAGLINRLRQETIRALEDGYSGLLVIQEMGGWLRALQDSQTIKAYETALSTFLPGSSCDCLCLYDLRECDPTQLLTLLEVHPHVHVEGEISENIYAISPEDLLELDVPTATLSRRLRRVVEHRRAEKARRMHTSLVELLHNVAWAGHEAYSEGEVIQIALEGVCRHIGWPVGHAYYVDSEKEELVPASLWYLEDEERFRHFRVLTEATRYPIGVGLPGSVAESGRPQWISDIRKSSDFLRGQTGKEIGVCSAFAIPISQNGNVRAVFEFFHGECVEEDFDLLEIMEEVGTQLAEVLDHKEAENELRLLESAVSHLEEAILVLTPRLTERGGHQIVYVNPAIEQITGYAPGEVLGKRVDFLFGPKTDRIVRRRAQRELEEGGSVSGETVAYRKDDSEFVLQWHMSPVRNGEGRITHLVAVYRDVTDERRAEEAIRRADHDSLTGLPNRTLFMRRLERSVERVQDNPAERFAVLFLDLDRFKVVNDSLGHLRGDQLLVALARRIERSVRPGDTVARFGGDEFVILLDRADAPEDVSAVARRIEQELESPFAIGGRSIYATASIGIALSDTGYVLPEDVLRDADTAMYRAKERGGGTYEVFDQSLYDDAVTLLRLETELHHAVDRGDFELRYQPIVSLTDGHTLGFEALVRWNHPDRGLLLPAEFLPMADETGLIVPIGKWVLDEAGRQLQSWQDRFEAATHLSLSVNLSAREFGTEDLVPTIRKVLRDHSLFSGTLQIEITENALIDRPDRVEGILHELQEMGVNICLDDFGTGYSSLSYLHRFPVRVLKIDRLFVERLDRGNGGVKRNEEIVRAILALARNLELDVTAEGVENRKQLRQLKRMACPNAQGFYFSEPLPAGRIEEILSRASAGGSGGHPPRSARAARKGRGRGGDGGSGNGSGGGPALDGHGNGHGNGHGTSST